MVTTSFILGDKYLGHPVLAVFVRNNPPVAGQYAGAAPFGSLVLDMSSGILWQNTGTLDASTWAKLGATLPSVVNAAALPTADPHSTGSIWVNSNVLTLSTG